MIATMTETEEQDVTDSDKQLSMVDEALVAGTIANTNGLLVILAKLVARGVFDRADLQAFSDSYSKPLDHVGMRENELVSPFTIANSLLRSPASRHTKILSCLRVP